MGKREDMPASQGLHPVTLDDLVVAIPSHLATEAQLKAGRSNRMVTTPPPPPPRSPRAGLQRMWASS